MNDSIQSECFSSDHGLDSAQLAKCIDDQLNIEGKLHVEVKNITVNDSHINDKTLHYRNILHTQFEQWRQDIKNIIDFKMEGMRQRMLRHLPKVDNPYPFMKLLPSEEYADLLVKELQKILEGNDSYTATHSQLSTELGQQVYRRYQMRLREQSGSAEKTRTIYRMYADILSSGKCSDMPRQLWQRITHHTRADGPCIIDDSVAWPRDTQCNIGRALIDILLNDLKIDVNLEVDGGKPKYEKVLYSIFRSREFVSRQEVRPNQQLKRIFEKAKSDLITFNSYEVPMVCYPLPWISPKLGGYLSVKSDLMRLPPSSPICLLDEVPEPQLYPSLDALNQLSCVPWRVNTRILDIAIKIFNLGGDEDLVIPLTPDSMLTDEHFAYRKTTRAEYEGKRAAANGESYTEQQHDIHCLYFDTLYKLSLANHYRDRVFWLPHSMDFRGRVYPIPPHLTHISADLTRSMLCFHQKQPLGEFGLERLKLHCVNLTGNKKRCSIAERLAYANEVLDDIIDSADNPLDGKRWWLDSDDPWQTLGVCMEITDAIRSPDPVNFMTGCPVHQDGSCNGLQHYAALGRDTAGAASVNLDVSERPQDVYTGVAERVEEKRRNDANADNESSGTARSLAGYIDRKVVKQTVMTSVYGVTVYGAMLQIKKQLKYKEFSPDYIGAASKYITKNTLEGLSEMFQSASQIQQWLTQVAHTIARDNHVQWVTPLGLPIIQPYVPDRRKQKSSKEKLKVTHRVKQKTAFPPNFIHSLDSSHMMLTALNCYNTGMTFVSVHDCFWTHPNKVPVMSQICREQFVLLHSQPILEDLTTDLRKQ